MKELCLILKPDFTRTRIDVILVKCVLLSITVVVTEFALNLQNFPLV